MKPPEKSGQRALWRSAVAGAAFAFLAACSTTGQSFNSSAMSKIVPGRTTFGQAQDLLGTAPTDIYQQGDGSLLARWAYKASMATDAFYVRQELLLRFGPDGRFERVVDSVNVPSGPGKPQDEQDAARSLRRAAVAPADTPNPVADASSKGIDNTVVTYPLQEK